MKYSCIWGSNWNHFLASKTGTFLNFPAGILKILRIPEKSYSFLYFMKKIFLLENRKMHPRGGEYKSIVMAGPGWTLINSNACLCIGLEMHGPMQYLALLMSLIPKFVWDPIYRLMFRYHGWLFGKLGQVSFVG